MTDGRGGPADRCWQFPGGQIAPIADLLKIKGDMQREQANLRLAVLGLQQTQENDIKEAIKKQSFTLTSYINALVGLRKKSLGCRGQLQHPLRS